MPNSCPATSQVADSRRDANYAVFRDCLSSMLLSPKTKAVSGLSITSRGAKRRRRAKPSQGKKATTPEIADLDPGDEADDLSDFIDYLASGIFKSLPAVLQDLSYRSWRESEELRAQHTLPLTPDALSNLGLDLAPSILETLVAYNLVTADPKLESPLPATTEDFLAPILTLYIETVTVPPPASWATRTDECELCGRDWIPLSYHHLIPRFVHDKAVKRGWHRKEDLQNVAWLCGACHRCVHRFKSHEELARDYYTVERLLADEDIQKFAAWAGRLRWKGG